jgi:hypothetical protein
MDGWIFNVTGGGMQGAVLVVAGLHFKNQWGEKCYTQTHSPHINGIAYRDCTG